MPNQTPFFWHAFSWPIFPILDRHPKPRSSLSSSAGIFSRARFFFAFLRSSPTSTMPILCFRFPLQSPGPSGTPSSTPASFAPRGSLSKRAPGSAYGLEYDTHTCYTCIMHNIHPMHNIGYNIHFSYVWWISYFFSGEKGCNLCHHLTNADTLSPLTLTLRFSATLTLTYFFDALW